MDAFALFMAIWIETETARLGHDSYGQRQAASRTLRSLMPFAEARLEKAKESLDPEVARRAENIIVEWYNSQPDEWFYERASKIRCKGYKVAPWIDSLPNDYPFRQEIINTYLKLARTDSNGSYHYPQSPYFEDHRKATTLWAADMLKWGKKEVDIQRIYAKMVEHEIKLITERNWGNVLKQVLEE